MIVCDPAIQWYTWVSSLVLGCGIRELACIFIRTGYLLHISCFLIWVFGVNLAPGGCRAQLVLLLSNKFKVRDSFLSTKLKNVKYDRATLSVWRCMSSLVFCIQEPINKLKCTNVLQSHALSFVRDYMLEISISQEDNNPKHKSQYVMKWYEG